MRVAEMLCESDGLLFFEAIAGNGDVADDIVVQVFFPRYVRPGFGLDPKVSVPVRDYGCRMFSALCDPGQEMILVGVQLFGPAASPPVQIGDTAGETTQEIEVGGYNFVAWYDVI